MTDDLIERLRFFDTQIANACADALEAQARRIAELEEVHGANLKAIQINADVFADGMKKMIALCDTKAARIAELEAESKARLTDASTAWDLCETLRARIAELEAALREAYEVYAGSDGFIPETAAEGYQQQLIKQMVDIIGGALAKENTDLRAALEKKG